jgi:maltooligosyltrehalose trehalohydrolase
MHAEGVHFRVWAPRARTIQVVFGDTGRPAVTLEPESNGYFAGDTEGSAGLLYRYQVDSEQPVPDPWSRFQPQGPHGPSMVIDPSVHVWRDSNWRGIRIEKQVIYECHVGILTREGTFDAAARELPFLADLGITCVELMPVAEFPGRFNWGYDGVDLFAPFHGYGDHHALKRFVDRAHGLGLGVILDVVYNHLGADGNYLGCFSPDYFTERYRNEWGAAINFDGPTSGPVRELFVENAAYWIREFHLDGLRLDATQSLFDASQPHIVADIVARTRAEAAPRQIILIGENEPQRAEQLHPIEAGGFGLDALWNDDFHHSARVAATGRRHGYFADYRGTAQELLSTVKYGFLFQGQYYRWQRKPRGSPALDRPAHSFVAALQNHDQVANTFTGQRIHELTSAGRLRALTALMLLGPMTPMLFMGQEVAASTPFTFFADQEGELGRSIREGRKKFLAQFRDYATLDAQACLPDPTATATFQSCKLDPSDRLTHEAQLLVHKDLIAVRRKDEVLSRQDATSLDGAILNERAFLIRWFADDAGDRLLLINLGEDLEMTIAPEPLLAPPRGHRWQQAWSSEDCRYGGSGAVDVTRSPLWTLPAESAVLLRACREPTHES